MTNRTERLKARFEQVCKRKGLDPTSQETIDRFAAKGGVFARVAASIARQSGGKLAVKGSVRKMRLKGGPK